MECELSRVIVQYCSQIPTVYISVMQLQYVLFASRVPNYMAGRPTSPAEIVNPAAVMTLAMIQSERWSSLDLGAEINQEHVVIQWCARRRLLCNCSTCGSCNLPMHLTNYAQNVDGKRWKCRACNTTRSIRYQSFFSRSHLSLRQIIVFLYCWCPDLPLNVCIHGSLGHHGNYSRRTCRSLFSEMHVTRKQCSRNF